MEEFDSEDFSTSEEDEDYVPSGGEYSEDDVNELVKEDEVDGEEQTQKTQGKKRKAQSIPARKRKRGGLSLEGEEDVAAGAESGGTSSEEEDGSAEQEKGSESEDARKKKEDELWASFLNDVGPKSKVSQVGVFKKANQIGLTFLPKCISICGLKAQIPFEVLRNFPQQTLEGNFSNQFSGLWIVILYFTTTPYCIHQIV
ncbi:PREDICTED: craniofacial development protein 1-like [Elephantulus edwardii]|uniref:craniofacial development protein 1-like n=1 Tax=Elephantulus edwardii TaxID=28737 RepID=UPI0003F09541|nr:PREDICTED: craniofacial development protein 1-like [Elephantulus edwardii]